MSRFRGAFVVLGLLLGSLAIGMATRSSVAALPAGTPPSPGMTTNPASGNSATSIALTFAAPNNVCPGDSATGNYRVNSFMVPASVDVATLTYNASGPIAPAGVANVFPLFAAIGQSAILNRNTAVATGQLTNLPAAAFGVFTPGQIPAGEYKIGYACSRAPALGQPQETERYWQQIITVTADATGGPAQFVWTTGAVPPPTTTVPVTTTTTVPVTTTTVPVTTTTVPVTTTTTVPVTTTTVLVTTTTTVPVTTTTVPVTTTTTTAPPPPPPPPPPPLADRGTGNTLTPSTGVNTPTTSMILGVTAPSNVCQGDSATGGYRWSMYVAAGAVDPGTLTIAAGAISAPGGAYASVLFTPTGSPQVNRNTAAATGQIVGTLAVNLETSAIPGNGAYNVGFICTLAGRTTRSWSTTIIVSNWTSPTSFNWSAFVPPPQEVVQSVIVRRPAAGTLTIQQRCGYFGPLPATQDEDFDVLPPLQATGSGVPLGLPCVIDLGSVVLLETGPNQGRFFGAVGRLNQVVVTDSRNTAKGWTLSARMTPFKDSNGVSFPGSSLGWYPSVTSQSGPTGTGYSQRVDPGPAVAAVRDGGLGVSRVLASTQPGANLGVARLDARLKLLMPIDVPPGDYAGTLTFTLV